MLWAELLMHGAADGPERMRSLMELSDQFGRPLELERAVHRRCAEDPGAGAR